MAPFMAEMEAGVWRRYEPGGFRAQGADANYVDHRAIFEGMNAHLWAPNSGRMLWMTQPAWPSTIGRFSAPTTTRRLRFTGEESLRAAARATRSQRITTWQVVNTTYEAQNGLSVTRECVFAG